MNSLQISTKNCGNSFENSENTKTRVFCHPVCDLVFSWNCRRQQLSFLQDCHCRCEQLGMIDAWQSCRLLQRGTRVV